MRAGDIVARLDDTQARANLAIVVKALDENAARAAREEAERDDSDHVEFPKDLLERINNPDVAKAVDGERKQFEMRRTGAGRQARPAQGADCPAARGNPRKRIADRIQEEAGRLGGQGAGRRTRSLGEKSHPICAPDGAGAREGTAGRRTRPADRGDRAGQGQDHGNGAANSPDRSGYAFRSRQGPRRDPGQDRRAGREKGCRGGSAQARGHPRADRRRRLSEDGAYGGRRDHGGRGAHARSFRKPTRWRPKSRFNRRTSIRCASGRTPFCASPPSTSARRPSSTARSTGFRPTSRRIKKPARRYYTVRIAIPASEIARLKGLKIVPGMPVECLYSDQPPHGDVLSDQAAPRPDQPRVSREIERGRFSGTRNFTGLWTCPAFWTRPAGATSQAKSRSNCGRKNAESSTTQSSEHRRTTPWPAACDR